MFALHNEASPAPPPALHQRLGPDQPGLEQCPGQPPPSLLGIRQGPDSALFGSQTLMSLRALDHTSLHGGGTV